MALSVVRCLCAGVFVVGTLAIPHDSLATTICLPEPPCEYALNSKKTAIVGTVVGSEVRLSTNRLLYEVVTDFVIAEAFGADVGSRVSIATNFTLSPESAREVFLPKGSSFLVYAEYKDGGWRAGQCSSPIPLADAARDLEVLRAARSGAVEPRLSGRVSMSTWQEGSLAWAPNISVTATLQVAGRTAHETHETLTNAQGEYRFLGLPPGQYLIAPKVEPPLKARFERETIVDFHGCKDDVSLFLTTASFSGTVRGADGAPVEGARIRVVDVDEPEAAVYRRDEFTKKDGHWSVDGVPDGRYLITLNAFSGPSARSPYPPMWYPGVSEANGAEVVTLEHDRPRQIDFTVPAPLPTGTITGFVVDGSGRPAAGASVSLADADFPAENAGWATTDTQGRFTMRALVGRRLTLRARHYSRGAPFVSEPLAVYLAEREDGAPITQEVWLGAVQQVPETVNDR